MGKGCVNKQESEKKCNDVAKKPQNGTITETPEIWKNLATEIMCEFDCKV